MMIEPAPGGGWWLLVRAAVAVALVGMAGAFPCCCHPSPDSSTRTSTTSTSSLPPGSTSTDSPPPLPPRPGSSAGPIPIPPRKSSSVGPIAFTECECCAEGEVADQWQVEVSGVVGTGFCSPDTSDYANGVFICDGGIQTQIDSYYGTCVTTDVLGCGCGGTDVPSIFCPEERLFISWQLYLASVEGVVSGTSVAYQTRFRIVWRGVPPSFCGGPFYLWYTQWSSHTKPAFAPLSCVYVPDDEKINCTELNGIALPGIASGTEGSLCELFYVEGF